MDTVELNLAVAGKISDALKQGRRSVAWLSRESGISYSTMNRIMAGNARVTVGELALIAQLLEVSTETLLPRDFGR